MKRIYNFSLIEMLLVAGLLAILITLLQPSLKDLIMKGGTLQCQNNQRQIYQGYSFYAEENSDQIVPSIQITYANNSSDWRTATRLVTWDEAILNYFRHSEIPKDFIESSRFHNYKRNYETEGLSVFSCPRHSEVSAKLHNWVQSDRAFQRSYSTIGIPFKNTINTNHDHYYLKNGPSGSNWSMRYHELPAPSDTFLLSEHFHGHNMIGYLALQNQRGPDSFNNYHDSYGLESPHGNLSFNFLYTDGHTQNLFIFEYGLTTLDRHGPWTMKSDD